MIRQILKRLDEIVQLLMKHVELQLQHNTVLTTDNQGTVMSVAEVKEFNIDDYLNVNQIALRYEVSMRQVYRWAEWKLIIPDLQIGEKDLFSKEQIDTAVREGRIAKPKRKGRPRKK